MSPRRFGHDLDRFDEQFRRRHLAGNEAPPNQSVNRKLSLIEKSRVTLRRTANTGWADRFMRILRPSLALVKIRFLRGIFLAELFADELQRFSLGIARHVNRV